MAVLRRWLLFFIVIVAPITCWGFVLGPCFVMQYVVSFLVLLSSFAIILLGKRELLALLLWYSECNVSIVVLCPFLTVLWASLYCCV